MALVSTFTDKLTNGNGKNHSDSDADLLTLADPLLMRVVKREGNIVPYDKEKIQRAVGLCFESVAERIGGITHQIVTDQVDTILRLKSLQLSENGHLAEIGIEAIQDIVEAQLMALGQFEAAKHYILYRDERRRVREESRGVSQETREFFKVGCATFTGVNRLLQEVQAFDKFSRFRHDFTPKRRETWPESCQRVMDYYRRHVSKIAPGAIPEETWVVMNDYLLHHKATGSMRGIQMAGPALERCQSGIYNCAFGFMDSPEAMAEDLYLLMQGVGFGFSVEEEYAIDKWPRVHAKRDCAPVDYTVEDDTEAWCNAVKIGLYHWLDGVDVRFDLSLIRPAGSILRTKGGRACLTGDTVVYKDKKKDGTSNTLTVSELYWRRLHRPGRLKQIQIRCLDEASGTFQRNHILDVVDNGVTDVYEIVTEAGYRIKATSNHRFMNSDRNYQELKDFSVGDYIAVNGTDLSDPKWKTGKCVDCGTSVSSRAERCRSCSLKAGRCDGCGAVMSARGGLCLDCREKSGRCLDCGTEISRRASRCKPCCDKAQYKDDALATTARQRKECRKAFGPVCSLCGRDDIRTEVHHVDGNVFNNAPENLMNLCSPCHQRLHAVERTFGNPYSHKYLSFDVITSIQHAGKERVFDLCMKAPNHNFVANGFVSHNSGPRPLKDLLDFDRDLIFRRQRQRLTSLDIHDMTCMLHRIGQMGGVRRASGLSLSDKNDLLMRHAKDGEFFSKYPWRNQANDSAVYESKPTAVEFMEEWIALAKSGSGERGIFNRGGLEYQLPERRKRGYAFGTNPCLTGETLVFVADGRGAVSIRELAECGKDVPVFCMDAQGKLQIRYMRHPRVTGYQEPIFKVILDDGCSIRVTKNHRFMLKDRTYCEAHGLRPGMSLRLMTRYLPEATDPNSMSRADRYAFMGIGGDSYFEHVMIAEFYSGRQVQPGEHVHHKDENRLRNDPDNLEIKSGFDHLSEHGTGEFNPNVCEVSNNELIEKGRNLVKSLGKRFSVAEWIEFSQNNGLPQNFSNWRQNSLGTVTAFSKRCAVLEGMGDFANFDPRVVGTYKKMILDGLDAEIVNGKVFIRKKCEGCGDEFTVPHVRREVCFCSLDCSKMVPETPEVKVKRLKNQAEAFDKKRKELREKQLEVFSELKNVLGRNPQKKEWVNSCQLKGISTEMCRQSSPFISWKALQEAGVDSNHRVVSVELDGYEDVYNGTVDDFHNFCVGGWDGGVTAKGRRRQWWCFNAQCGEIILRNHQFCNLSIAIVEVHDSYEEIEKKVEIATIWGTIQASMTNFRYLRPDWKENCEEEALLGVDILGHMDCKLLKPGASGREEILQKLRQKCREVNIYWANRLGIKPSAALTCGKPSGDSSVFFDKPAGFKPHHGRFWVRRLRFEETNPIAKVLKDAKIPWQLDYDKTGMCVFEFPCRAPDDTIILGDMTSIEQLENWKTWKVNFTEHNPSVTISVKDNEWLETGNWVYQNWDIVGGIAFFPYDDSIYPLAPYQTITEQEYAQRNKMMPTEIDWSKILLYEDEDETTLAGQIACTGPGCDV